MGSFPADHSGGDGVSLSRKDYKTLLNRILVTCVLLALLELP
jgi:hypothetical protein